MSTSVSFAAVDEGAEGYEGNPCVLWHPHLLWHSPPTPYSGFSFAEVDEGVVVQEECRNLFTLAPVINY